MINKRYFYLLAVLCLLQGQLFADCSSKNCSDQKANKNGEFVVDQEHYRCGEESVKFCLDYFVQIGQGTFFKNMKAMLAQGKAIRTALTQISMEGTIGMVMKQRRSFLKGAVSALEKIDCNDFVKKANFADWQAELMIEVIEFLQKHVRAYASIEPRDWHAYKTTHRAEFCRFYSEKLVKVTQELELSEDFLNKPLELLSFLINPSLIAYTFPDKCNVHQ